MKGGRSLADPLQEYRAHCVSAEQKAQEDYDKAVLSLSGGALGISFAFVKDVVGPGAIQHSVVLLSAWAAWGASVVVTLASYWFSQRALRAAITQVDNKTIHTQTAGRSWAPITSWLNALGGILFVVGVAAMVWFVYLNLGSVGTQRQNTDLTVREMSPALLVGPFRDADTVLADVKWSELDRELLAQMKALNYDRKIDGVLVLGGVDRRPISARTQRRFASNQALAIARAEAVRSRVIRKVGDSIPVFVLTAGALELEFATNALDLERDRRVSVRLIHSMTINRSKLVKP